MRKIILSVMSVVAHIHMFCLRPIRILGYFGTPADPIYYGEGDTVPWWMEFRWPLNSSVTFMADVETYYERGQQIVRPQINDPEWLIYFDTSGRNFGLLHGAPTTLIRDSRRPPPNRVGQILEHYG